MKRIYSIILLLAFCVGVIQPIMPMIEYQLYSGSIINLLGSSPDDSCDDPLLIVEANCPKEQNSTQDLLDDSYYPIALQISASPELRVFQHVQPFNLASSNTIHNIAYTPTPPPPKLS